MLGGLRRSLARYGAIDLFRKKAGSELDDSRGSRRYGTQRAALFDGSIVVPPGLSR